MPSLFDTTLDLARRLTAVHEGNATAVAATSITDSGAGFVNGLFQGGTLWLHDTVPVTKLVELSGADKVTFATGTVPTAAVRYSLAGRDYPRDILKQAINQTVSELRAGVTETTLVSVADQLAYTITLFDILTVEVEDAFTPGEYHLHQGWHEVETQLRFMPGCEVELDGLNIRITTRKAHATLTLDADVIPAHIDYELLVWKATTHALRWGLEQYGQDQAKRVPERLNEAQTEVARRGGNKRLLNRTTIKGGW